MVKKEVIERLVTLMTAAFGLIAALAWNEAVKGLFAEGGALNFMAKYGVWFYAIFVTLLAVMVTIWISKIGEKVK
jgi:hypothetical protein